MKIGTLLLLIAATIYAGWLIIYPITPEYRLVGIVPLIPLVINGNVNRIGVKNVLKRLDK